ncbi:MAG: PGF-pre-PGF domain-containing protein [Nanoarchaeota archaeon]|nr:PGF-pre-PGF domain-containing protein [DPANN group archaeon]MBL7116838.1 PGF-pre-PGF domain-containing protein [Nanoarchaeota archaeon]
MKKTIFLFLVLLLVSATLVSGEVRVLNGEKSFIVKENNKEKLLEKLDIKKNKIVLQKELVGDDIKYTFYKQKHKGLEVYGSWVGFIEKKGRIVSVKSNYEELDIDTDPLITAKEASTIVSDDIGEDVKSEPELIIYKNPFKGPDYLLAYKVKTPFLEDKVEKWLYFVDAKTGKIIFRETLLIFISGNVTAQVFPETPAQSQMIVNLTNSTVTVWQNSSMIASVLTNNGFYNVSNVTGNITIKANLEGPYARILNADQSRAYHEFNTTGNSTHNWNWNESDSSDRDEESNVFYHMNIIHDYFTSGDPFNITQMNFQMNATVQYGGASCNAFYDTDLDSLSFYGGAAGCDNPALSADVVYHEYTHAVTSHIYGNIPYYKITGAMSEAFSDYFAATITNNPAIGEDNWNSPIRNLSNTKSYLNSSHYQTCPAGETPNSENDYCYIHDNSEVLGGALWDFRELVGNETADALVIKTIKARSHSFSEFLEDMLVIDDDNANLSDGTPNSTYICQAFANHDIYSYYCNQTKHSFTIEEASVSWYNASNNGSIISAAESTDGVQGLGDDDITNPINLSFEFPFHGQKYTQVFIGSNGLVTLQNYSVDIFRYDCFIPDSNLPNTVIAPLCTDLDPFAGGDVYYWSQSDKFIVEWKDVVLYGKSDQENFEVVLFDNGKILMQYLNTTNITTVTKVGVEDELGVAADILNFSDVNSLAPSAFLFVPTNDAPNITSSYPSSTNISIVEPNNQTFNISYSDSENDSLTASWYLDGVWVVNGSEYNFTGNYTNNGTYNITVQVSDYLNTTVNTWVLTVNNTDTIPVIDSFSPNFSNISVYENSTQLFNHTSSDADGDALSYSWLLNSSEQANTSYWSYSPNFTASGNWNVTLIVSDTQNNTVINYWNVTVVNLNRAPVWNSIENQSITTNQTVNYTLNASDADGDNLTFWVNNSDVNITGSNLTYEPGNFTGEFTITIAALDNETNTTVFMTITVNDPPVHNVTIPNQAWNEDSSKNNAFDLDNYFYDNQDNLSYGYVNNSNIVISISAGNVVSFSQPSTWFGSEIVRFYANDSYIVTYSNSVSLTVNEVEDDGNGGSSRSSGPGVSLPPSSLDTVSRTWAVVSAGTVKTLVVESKEIPVTGITFEAKNDLLQAKISVKKLDDEPETEKKISKSKKVYKYLQISKTNIENRDIEEATISFEVEKEWLRNSSLERDDVALFRYAAGWDELPTNIMRENLTTVFYNATTPGFSYFAIGEKEREEISVVQENVTVNESADLNFSIPFEEINESEEETNMTSEEVIKKKPSEMPQSLKFLIAVLILYLLLGRPKLKWKFRKKKGSHKKED